MLISDSLPQDSMQNTNVSVWSYYILLKVISTLSACLCITAYVTITRNKSILVHIIVIVTTQRQLFVFLLTLHMSHVHKICMLFNGVKLHHKGGSRNTLLKGSHKQNMLIVSQFRSVNYNCLNLSQRQTNDRNEKIKLPKSDVGGIQQP